jgi:hypothetical protein
LCAESKGLKAQSSVPIRVAVGNAAESSGANGVAGAAANGVENGVENGVRLRNARRKIWTK